jgi:hypothetical protein
VVVEARRRRPHRQRLRGADARGVPRVDVVALDVAAHRHRRVDPPERHRPGEARLRSTDASGERTNGCDGLRPPLGLGRRRVPLRELKVDRARRRELDARLPRGLAAEVRAPRIPLVVGVDAPAVVPLLGVVVRVIVGRVADREPGALAADRVDRCDGEPTRFRGVELAGRLAVDDEELGAEARGHHRGREVHALDQPRDGTVRGRVVDPAVPGDADPEPHAGHRRAHVAGRSARMAGEPLRTRVELHHRGAHRAQERQRVGHRRRQTVARPQREGVAGGDGGRRRALAELGLHELLGAVDQGVDVHRTAPNA